MMKRFKNSRRPLALAVMLTASASQINAESLMLEEIVVTAQKRVESLQDVPISVSAVSGDKIAEAGIENLQDLSAYVPNLKVVEGGLVPQMFIRGIGSGGNQGFEQSVATYADGVYYGRSLQSRSAFMDLERVEVLRGPQSILFGKNSIAGAISLVSAKPTEEFEGKVSASYAPQFNEQEINAYVSGALSDTVRGRLAIRDRQEGGYIENPTLNRDQPQTDEQAIRAIFEWDASEELLATLKLEHSNIEKLGRPREAIDLGSYALVAGPLQDDGQANHTTFANGDSALEFESNNFMLKLDYALGDHTLTSVSGYSDYKYSELDYDADNTEVQVNSLDMFEEFEQLSQELRLVSPGGETIDYIVGAFYQTSEQKYLENASVQASNVGFPVNLYTARPFTQESDTWAIFAQATWNIDETLRVTGGLRYTEESKSGSRSQASSDLLTGGQIPAFFQGILKLQDHDLNGKRDEEILTPSLNVQYDLDGDTMLYFTYSTGYKSGGFDARGINAYTSTNNPLGLNSTSLGGDNFEFEEEEAATFELGAKMGLLDGAGELNVSLFQTDYEQMQVSVFDGLLGFNVLNAGAATVRGIEMDGRWMATENLTLSSGLAYLDFEWTDYDEAPCPSVGISTPSSSGSGNCSFAGMENMQTPEWTFNLSANHTYALGDNLELRTTVDANFKDNHYTSGNLDERQQQRAATVWNMRMGLASTDDVWQVAFVGKNLSDQRIMNYGTKISLSGSGISTELMRPRTFALEGSYSF